VTQNQDLIGPCRTEDNDRNDYKKESTPGHSFFTSDLLELELALDPSVEFLLKSSPVHPVQVGVLLTPGP
jgi:hypothetical protein